MRNRFHNSRALGITYGRDRQPCERWERKASHSNFTPVPPGSLALALLTATLAATLFTATLAATLFVFIIVCHFFPPCSRMFEIRSSRLLKK